MVRWIRLAWVGDAFRGDPGEDVGDLLVGHRAVRASAAPVGHAFVGPSGDDDAAQILVADEREIGWIDDGAELALARVGAAIGRSAFAGGAVAARAEDAVGLKTVVSVAGQRSKIRRQSFAGQRAGVAPLLDDALRPARRPAASVNMPPELFAKGGISLPGTPLAITLRMRSSPASAM